MNCKYELNLFSFHDHTGIAAHLEKMAARGWLLEKAGLLWRYAKCEPRTVHYAVTYLWEPSQFSGPSEKELHFRDLCAQAGWEFVARWGEMLIFRNFYTNPVPLETEPTVQVDTVQKTMKWRLLSLFILSFYAFTLLRYQLLLFSFDPVRNVLLNQSRILQMILSVVFIFLPLREILSYFLWHRRAKAAAKEGRFLPTSGRRWSYALVYLLLAAELAFLFYSMELRGRLEFLGVLAAIFVMKKAYHLLKRRQAARNTQPRQAALTWAIFTGAFGLFLLVIFSLNGTLDNWLRGADSVDHGGYFTTYIYHDELPLYMGDLVEVDNDDYSNEMDVNHSLTMTETDVTIRRTKYSDDYPTSLEYTVWTSQSDSALDMMLQSRMDWYTGRTDKEYSFQAIDMEGASEAWQLYEYASRRNHYFFRFSDRVIELSMTFTPDETQMATAMEKLLAI